MRAAASLGRPRPVPRRGDIFCERNQTMDIIQILAQELDKDPRHVANVVQLLDEGNTIPFIARYRKELHGAMDDTPSAPWRSG